MTSRTGWGRGAAALSVVVVLAAVAAGAWAAGFAWWYDKPLPEPPHDAEHVGMNPLLYPRHVLASMVVATGFSFVALAAVSPVVTLLVLRGRRRRVAAGSAAPPDGG
jgi:hypothetical protein